MKSHLRYTVIYLFILIAVLSISAYNPETAGQTSQIPVEEWPRWLTILMNLAPWIVIISLWGFLAKRLKNNSNESQISHASIINTQFTAIPACNSSKEYEDALVLCSALDIYNRKFNGNSDPITAYTQFLRAETYQQKGDIELCHNEIQKGLKLSEACNEMQIYGKLHRVLAQVSLAQNKYDEAQKAIEIAKEKCQSGYNNDMQDEQNLIQSIYNQIQAAQNKS